MLCQPAEAEAFEAMALSAHAAGRLRIARLLIDGAPAAHAVDVTAGVIGKGGGVFSLKTAFDEAWAEHSPGFLLEVALIEDALAEPGRWTDSCAGEGNDAVARLWPETRDLLQILVGRPGARGWALFGAARGLERASARMRGERG